MADELLADRAAGGRYRIDEPDGTWWEIGWDSSLGTFCAEQRSPLPFDPFTPDDPLASHGRSHGELPSVVALGARLSLSIPDDIARELQRDAVAHPHVADASRLDLADAPEPDEPPPPAAPTLPAQALADTLVRLRHDPHLGADDFAYFARGLGLDPAMAAGVLDGTISELSVDQIAAVCEALRCSPYDLWGAERAREILDVYGPERWPRYIEPLDDGRQIAGADEFLRRRVEQQADAAVTIVNDASNEPFVLEVTGFRQTGVLAVDGAGRVSPVEDAHQPADPATEYHFTFRQLGHAVDIVPPFGADTFERGCPPGHDAPPALVSLAESLERAKPGTDMMRFVDANSGHEQWLGRETPFDPWQTWDDPRLHYPGNPADVLACMIDEDVPRLPLPDIDRSDSVELAAEASSIDTVSLDF